MTLLSFITVFHPRDHRSLSRRPPFLQQKPSSIHTRFVLLGIFCFFRTNRQTDRQTYTGPRYRPAERHTQTRACRQLHRFMYIQGRKHQLRRHMAQVCRCPILGDRTYGTITYSMSLLVQLSHVQYILQLRPGFKRPMRM